MRINIIYEVNNREFNNCLLLQRELISRGYDARVYNKTEDIIIHNSSDSITIIPNSYRTSDLNHYRYTFDTNIGLIIVYPCEQVTNHRMPTFFDCSDDNIVKRLPHLCWSRDYYEFLRSLGYNSNENRIVGAIQLDYCRPEFTSFFLSRKEISEKYHIPNDKKWMLFISDFVLDNEEKFNRLLKSGDVEERLIYKRREHERKSTSEILYWFKSFLISHNDYILIYRKHPVEILSDTIIQFQKECPDHIFCISDYGIKDWIINSDRIVTWNSTAAVECFAANRNIHLLRPYEFDASEGITEYSFYKKMKRITYYDEFAKNIEEDIWSFTDESISEIKKLYNIEEIPAYIRVANAIEDIQKHKQKPLFKESFFINRWKYIIINCIIPKILVKKALEKIYIKTGKRFGRQNEKGAAVNEWMATAINRKEEKERSKILDSIIARNKKREDECNGKISD